MSYDYVDRIYAVEQGAGKSNLCDSHIQRKIEDLGAERKAINKLIQQSDDEQSPNCLINQLTGYIIVIIRVLWD